MEDQHAAIALPDALDEDHDPTFTALQSQRDRVHEFFSGQRQQLVEIHAKLVEFSEKLVHVHDGAVDDDSVAQLLEELTEARQERRRLESQLAERAEELRCQQRENEKFKAELGTLSQQLDKSRMESGNPKAADSDDDVHQELQDLEYRYEMALEDLKAERGRFAELEAKAAQPSAAAGDSSESDIGMDWESQKRRLLASLEKDFDEEDDEDQQDKLSVEEAIRLTDEVIAAKEREVTELQQLLEEQSSNLGSMAVGVAAVAEVLDKDEVIQLERANLQALQDEWRDKLRQSEVEISIERAKLARKGVQLEEQARQLELQNRDIPPQGEAPNGKGKPIRGRWLRRLGLKGDDDA